MRILLVEDEPNVAITLSALLGCEGFDVVVAESCASARKAAAEDPSFRALLVDQHLGDGEGLSLVPILRQLCGSAPIFLLTGLPEAHQGEKGVDGVFGKTEAAERLLESLKNVVKGRGERP